MSAINLVCGHREILVLTDTAFCQADGNLIKVASRAICEMSDGLILAGDLAGLQLPLADRFDGFDSAVENIESELVSLGARSCVLYLAGWSARREESEAYAIATHDTVISSWDPYDRESSEHHLAPHKLLRLPHFFLSPVPDPMALEAASIGRLHVAWRNDRLLDELGKVITAQRHSQYDGRHLVGGSAESKSVDVNMDSVCDLNRPKISWDYDQVGSPISPRPSDWDSMRIK